MMKKSHIWAYGLSASVILISVAGFAIIGSKKPGPGGVIRDQMEIHSAKGIKAKSPRPSGKALVQASEQALNDALDKYAKTDNSDEKVIILYELALNSNSKVLELVYKALEDPSDDVRIAAAQLLSNFDANSVIPAISKALDDKNDEVRLLSMQVLGDADAPETGKLLARGVSDNSENVRNAVFSSVSGKDIPTKEAVLGEAIRSEFQDVRGKIVELAVETRSHRTVEMLLGALKDNDEELGKEIFAVMTVFFSEEFKTSGEARNWWAKNKGRFDNELFEK